jgi:hypothetical protein
MFCSTPDYITPEMPQVTNEFDDDKVGKMRFSLFECAYGNAVTV